MENQEATDSFVTTLTTAFSGLFLTQGLYSYEIAGSSPAKVQSDSSVATCLGFPRRRRWATIGKGSGGVDENPYLARMESF